MLKRSFSPGKTLAAGGPKGSLPLDQPASRAQGTDTLNCLVEGFRFAMAAHEDALIAWWGLCDASRKHS